MTPAEVGRAAVVTIERGRRVWMIPARGRWIYRLTPPPVMRRLIALTGWKR